MAVFEPNDEPLWTEVQLVALVGVAPVRSAEFVRFRIGQFVSGHCR